jgi:hypothetical protein
VSRIRLSEFTAMTTELLEQLKTLTTSERLELIEAATRLIRDDLRRQSAPAGERSDGSGEDAVLQVIGSLSSESLSSEEIDHELYGNDQTR